jgi:hypothetical protein
MTFRDPIRSHVGALFGVVPIKDTCMACSNPAVAVFPIRTPEECGVYWLCDQHALTMIGATGGDPAGMPSELSRTCGLGDDVPCGALASHVAIIGTRDDEGAPLGLGIVSVCQRHLSSYPGNTVVHGEQ